MWYISWALPLASTLRSKPAEKVVPRPVRMTTVFSLSASSKAACNASSIVTDITLTLPSSITILLIGPERVEVTGLVIHISFILLQGYERQITGPGTRIPQGHINAG